MNKEFSIHRLDKKLRILIAVYLIVQSMGFLAGLGFVQQTTGASPEGIVEQYNGNEDNEEAELMKFRKSSYEMTNIIHTHILSLSLIFVITAFFVYLCQLPSPLKSFLMIEPLLSLIFSFGGLYLIWSGVEFFKYIVMLSGVLMALGYFLSVIIVLYQICKNPKI